MDLNKRTEPNMLMPCTIFVIGFVVVLVLFLIPDEEEKPNPIRNEQLTIVEDTLNPDDSRIVSRVTVNKQKFIIFKLGRNYYAFEEQK